MTEERRRHPRTPPSPEWGIRCRSPGRGAPEYHLVTRVVDVSACGTCIVTSTRLREGSPVAVDVLLPNGDACFQSLATVRWSMTLESNGRIAHVAGLQFDRVFRLASTESEEHPSRVLLLRSPEPRRAHKRFTPEEVALVCLPRDFLRLLGLARNTGRRLKDISRGGAQIVCARKLRPGQRVDLRLEFRRAQATVEAQGVVRWCARDTTSLEPRYLAGVKFEKLPPGSERSLRAVERAFIGY